MSCLKRCILRVCARKCTGERERERCYDRVREARLREREMLREREKEMLRHNNGCYERELERERERGAAENVKRAKVGKKMRG